MAEKPSRTSLLGIIGGLMHAENLGDVHDEILFLCDLAGIPRPKGGFPNWTRGDWANVGQSPEEEELELAPLSPEAEAQLAAFRASPKGQAVQAAYEEAGRKLLEVFRAGPSLGELLRGFESRPEPRCHGCGATSLLDEVSGIYVCATCAQDRE